MAMIQIDEDTYDDLQYELHELRQTIGITIAYIQMGRLGTAVAVLPRRMGDLRDRMMERLRHRRERSKTA